LAKVVKKFGEISLAGKGYPTPRNQCWPEQVPSVFLNYGMQILQQLDKVTILYPFHHQFRHVRLNESHRTPVTPSWYGDSVGHYEGDALVVDTVGIKIGPYSMIDWYRTPYTGALHIVERYRLLDYDAIQVAIVRDAKENLQQPNPDSGPRVDPNYKGRGLQIEVTRGPRRFHGALVGDGHPAPGNRRMAGGRLCREHAVASGHLFQGANGATARILIRAINANRPALSRGAAVRPAAASGQPIKRDLQAKDRWSRPPRFLPIAT
jgi:hypothetical protein